MVIEYYKTDPFDEVTDEAAMVGGLGSLMAGFVLVYWASAAPPESAAMTVLLVIAVVLMTLVILIHHFVLATIVSDARELLHED